MAAAEQDHLLEPWGGPMFIRDRRGTKPSAKLTSLLRGIANTISSVIERDEHADISPASMAAFYRACGGDYDQLFINMPPQSISFIYVRLECPHSLQPARSSTFSAPIIPCLKQSGYVRWQTIQLLLGPEEHVPFLQNALLHFDVRDPDTGLLFPKQLPSIAFPMVPNPEMVAWHDSISTRLRIEAEQSQEVAQPKQHDSGVESSHEETASVDAAHFFANPLYKNKDGRPAIVRQLTKAPAALFQGGKLLAGNVIHGGKMILSPNTFGGPAPRRRSHSPSPNRGRDHDGHRMTSSHGNKYISEVERSGKRTPTSPKPGNVHSTQYRPSARSSSITPNSSEDADRDADNEAFEQDRRRTRRRSHDSRATSGSTPSDLDDGLRRNRSVDYRHGHGPGSRRPRNVSSGSALNPNAYSDDRNRNGHRPVAHSPPLSTRVQERQHRDAHREDLHRHEAHKQDYFGSASQSQARPSMPYRTASEANLYDGRSTNTRIPDSGYIVAEVRPKHGNKRSVDVKISPNTQAEWNDVRQNVGEVGTAGAKFSVPFANHSDQDTSETSSGQEKRQSMAKNVVPVNGVKGRKYPNEAPWVVSE